MPSPAINTAVLAVSKCTTTRKLVHHDMLDKGCNLDGVEDVIFRAIEQVVSEKHALMNALSDELKKSWYGPLNNMEPRKSTECD